MKNHIKTHYLCTTVLFLCFCVLILIQDYLFFHSSNLVLFIRNEASGFRQFHIDEEISISHIELQYFNPKSKKKCKICSFAPNNTDSNSSPKDVIISCAAHRTFNFVLFQRTLRTTHSNATIVLFLDRKAYESLDLDSLAFSKNCQTQIIITPDVPPSCPLKGSKNFMFYHICQFIRINEERINRVIFLDLFDSLFQADPFTKSFHKNEIYICREHLKNKINLDIPTWIRQFDPNFTLSDQQKEQKPLNSGFFGAYSRDMLTFFNEFLKYSSFDTRHDQALINMLDFYQVYQRIGLQIKPIDFNERVTHFSYKYITRPFPFLPGNYNDKITATIIHLYYNGNDNLRKSILYVCPRITKQMENYLDRKATNIQKLEYELESFKPTFDLKYQN